MSKNVVVVAPHPDDETLGCGGTMLRHKKMGDSIHWLIITHPSLELGYSLERIKSREQEIAKVANMYGFSSVINLKLPTTMLDTLPFTKIVEGISQAFNSICPETVYLPFGGDVHTDHRIVSDGVISCTKWFRYPFIKKVIAYETLSETEFGMECANKVFRKNLFVDISDYIEEKLEIIAQYRSELADFPFPRSEKAIRALASTRGATAGCMAAEAFMILKEIV